MKPLSAALTAVITPLLLALACTPPYAATYAPSEATFEVACEPGCGAEGRDDALFIRMSFEAGERQYATCCEHRPQLLARLQTIKDFWCDGLDVPPKAIGGLIVGTATSEVTKERGATIDDGEGYLTFNCDGWLEQLIDELSASSCCGSLSAAAPTDPR